MLGYSFLWQHLKLALCISLILNMPFSMVIFRRKYIWSNHGLLLWGRMIKFVDFANLCMGWNRVHEHGLENLVMHLSNLEWRKANRITQSSIDDLRMVIFYLLYMLMISDTSGILSFKSFLQSQFHTKDLGSAKVLLGYWSNEKQEGWFYVTEKICAWFAIWDRKIGSPCGPPMMPSLQHLKDGEPFKDPKRYRRLVERWITLQ